MKIHPVSVTAISGEELGRQIMALRYDQALEIITGMKIPKNLKECGQR